MKYHHSVFRIALTGMSVDCLVNREYLKNDNERKSKSIFKHSPDIIF